MKRKEVTTMLAQCLENKEERKEKFGYNFSSARRPMSIVSKAHRKNIKA